MYPVPRIELWLELDPVESESMKEGWQTFHQKQDADREWGPEHEDGPHDDSSHESVTTQPDSHDHVPEDFTELSVSQGQGPQS